MVRFSYFWKAIAMMRLTSSQCFIVYLFNETRFLLRTYVKYATLVVYSSHILMLANIKKER